MLSILGDTLLLTVTILGLALFGIALISGFVALLQAVTQIQESSVSHFVKVLALVGLVALGGEWAAYEVVTLFERVVGSVEVIQRELR